MNSNEALATELQIEIARSAGGLTITELRRRGAAIKINDERYYDVATDMWIPRGMLLFRPRSKMEEKTRDTLSLS